MSRFHYKAELLNQHGSLLTYRYFPNYVEEENRSGVFVVDAETRESEIIRASEHETGDASPVDERCVAALLHKLKKSKHPAPDTLYFVA